MASEQGKFHKLFERWASRTRARITARRALTGAAIGLLIGAGSAAIAWKTRQGQLRPWLFASGIVGLAAGVVVAQRKRWTDTEVALYLDGRLDSNEAITTAIELQKETDHDDPARAVVVEQAVAILEKAEPQKARPRILSRSHLLIPVSIAALFFLSRLPLPALPVVAAAPGTDRVQLALIDGLEKVAALESLRSPDPAQKERLKKLAEDAKKLREKLHEGMERREAQSEIARLKDAIAAERMSLGDGERRAGLEAAQGRLAQVPALKEAAKALGDRDLTQFDEEMQRLANSQEKVDREAAKKALEEAADAAKKGGAGDVGRALEEQRKLLEERSKRSEALKELGEALGNDLPEDLKKDLEDMAKGGSDKDSRDLAGKMADALGKLTPEERKKLAERLRKQAEDSKLAPSTRENMKDLAEELETPEGQKKLEDELRRMANEPLDSEESQREQALGEAQKGAGEAEGQIGGAPIPVPMAGGAPMPGDGKGEGKPGQGGKPGGKADGDGQGGPGSHHDTGRGDHKGSTPEVQGNGIRSRASGKINKGAPMPGVVSGRGQARPGETANLRGNGGIGEAAPGEVGGVDRSEIPEEYREQVGRYFSP